MEAPRSVSGWLPWAAMLVAAAGVAVASYLTYAHFTTAAALSCPDTGIVNCTKVTTSPESVIFGAIPVAVLGLAYFLTMVGLNLPWSWRAPGQAGAWLARVRLAGAVAGMGFVLYLVSVEILVIGAICIYCTLVHVLTFGLLLLVVAGTTQRGLRAWG
jgi:uncharacterized membrane protein